MVRRHGRSLARDAKAALRMTIRNAHALLLLGLGCCDGGAETPPNPPTFPSAASGSPSAASASPSAAPASPGSPGAPGAGLVDAGASPAAAEVDGGAAPVVADNKVAPTEGAELEARARGLFEAIVKDDPARAEPFWFPWEPFVPLKDVKDPGKYWDQLHRAYAHAVHALHEARRSWDGAEFVGFDGWSRPKWVPPGDEANKIGYHRAFNGKLRYRIGGAEASMDVHTIITWQGRWYVTHLRKVRR